MFTGDESCPGLSYFSWRPKNGPREQLRYGVFVFLSFLAVALAVGWIMYPLPL